MKKTVMVVCAAVSAGAALAAGKGVYGDVPDAKHAWAVHDWNRPKPTKVEPAAYVKTGVPSDAIVLFDGTRASFEKNWCDSKGNPSQWKLGDEGDFYCVPDWKNGGGIQTRAEFGDCQLHIEYRHEADITDGGKGPQMRGNSGVFLMGNYEIQVLDSYETDADASGGNKNPNYSDGQAGAAYGQNPPLVNPCRAPGVFNSYDIVFHAPIETAEGVIERPATVTVFFNGVVVQDHWLFDGPTGFRARSTYARTTSDTGLKRTAKMPIAFQDHGNPVHFRNVWVRELGRPEDNVTHGDWYAQPDKVLELRRETAAKLDAEFDAKWGNEPQLARKLVEAWRIVGYAVSPDRMARVSEIEKAYYAQIKDAKTTKEVDALGVGVWSMRTYYQGLLKCELILPDNPVLVKLESLK